MPEKKEEKPKILGEEKENVLSRNKRIDNLETRAKERDKIGFYYLTKDMQARILTLVQLTDLTDGGATTLHSHTPVATGFTSRARAYLGSNQNIDANTDTLVNLTTENYDGDGEFSSNVFTATTAGYYLVAVQALLEDLDDAERLQVFIKVNATTEWSRNASWCSKADSYTRVTLTDIVYLGAGQTVGMYVRHNAADGTQVLTAGTQNTYMSIHRLS